MPFPKKVKLHRTRQLTFMGLNSYMEALAVEQARAMHKKQRRYQVSYTYFLENEKSKKSSRQKVLTRTEKTFSSNLHLNKPGSLDYFLKKNLLNYTDEERSRVKLTNISILPMITDLQPVEPMFQFMNRFVLAPDWFKYANAILPISMKETSENCVALGLTHILLHPSHGKPTKWIDNLEVNFHNVTLKLEQLKTAEHRNQQPLPKGYSSSTLHRLLVVTRINHYAFDADGNNFLTCTTFESNHKSPIIWMVHNGHCHFVQSKEAIKSVAEAAKQIRSAPKGNKLKKLPTPEEVHLYEGDDLLVDLTTGNLVLDSMEPGIYLCNEPDLQDAYLFYVYAYRSEGLRPIQIDSNERVSEFSVMTKKGKLTFVANPDEGIADAHELKHAADNAGLTFRGQSLAKLTNDILDAPHTREYLTRAQEQEIVRKQKMKCASCNETLGQCEFDHLRALGNGGTNAVENFQALCLTCHKDKTSHELHAGYTFQSSFASTLHPIMQMEMQEPQSLVYARVEFVGEVHPDALIAEIDCVKCRRNLLGGYHSTTGKRFDWPVYGVTDIPVAYSGGQIQCGRYYVQTTIDLGPFRGSGWYYECSVVWGLNRGLITEEDIILEWIPSRSVPHDHFRPIIKQLLDAFAFDENLQKRAPNYLVGMFNKMTKQSRSVKFSLSRDEAGTWLAREDFSFVRNIKLQCGTDLYMGTFVAELFSDTTSRPIYQMVVEMEAIEIENLRVIVQQWAPPYSLKTDAVQFEEPGQCEVWEMQDWTRSQFWDEARLLPKYRYVAADNVRPLMRPSMVGLVRE